MVATRQHPINPTMKKHHPSAKSKMLPPRNTISCIVSSLGVLTLFGLTPSWPEEHTSPASEPRLDANHVAKVAIKSVGTSVIGQTISKLHVAEPHGRDFSFTRIRGKRLTVIAFLGTECPLAKLYSARLETLAQQYRNHGLTVIGFCSNAQDSQQDVTDFVHQHALTFPVFKDTRHRVADQLKAVRTPEVFLLDHEQRVVYWGRIDDQYAIGIKKAKPQRSDLKIAIDETLAGNKVSIPIAESVGCHIGRLEIPVPTADLTFHEHIIPLLRKHCVNCHKQDNIAPFALLHYDEVAGWAPMIREVVEGERMPPWFANPNHGNFKNNARLSAAEKATLLGWIERGCPPGSLDVVADIQIEQNKSAKSNWEIPEPDEVFFISDHPHTIPAQGQVDYEYFLVDPEFQEDKFLQAVQVKPGNYSVVHHALVSLVMPGNTSPGVGNCGVLINYAPGMQSTKLPAGMGIHVPAGAKFLFQMHYTPNGTQQRDRTSLGIVFANPRQVTSVVRGGAIANVGITIPPNTHDHHEVAELKIDRPVELLSLSPHMHLRGKAFRYEAFFPKGRREILLDVPKYDFNWQLRYLLEKPLPLPPGTRIRCTAWYDNSSRNPANPDSTLEIQWGDQTTDEMLIGFYSIVEPR
ncbi:MAG: thiol-disulfide isomerase [Rhodopirellula sp.]|nr:thiol-disulfide isomerase [Rhodopirellula sp.]